MAKGELADPFSLISTPATLYTGEEAVVIKFSVDSTKASRKPREGDTYRASKLCKVRLKEFGDYVCTAISGGGKYWTATFGAPKTEAEKNRPFHTFIRTENYPWEGVLEDYHAEPDFRSSLEMRDSGGNAFFQQKWNSRFHLRPAIQGASDIEYRLYISPTKYTNLGRPVIQQPVYVHNGNLPGDTSPPIGSVLIAKRIRVPVVVLGPVVIKYQTYGPTIPNGRARHLIDDDQEQNASGLWVRTEKFANPPFGQFRIADK